jgi:hypothetical protein
MTIKHEPGNIDLERIIAELASKVVKVGFFPDAKYDDGTQVAYIATIQEYGYIGGGIPARPFFEPSLAKGAENYKAGFVAAFRRTAKGTQTIAQGLEQIGALAKGDIQDGIKAVMSPALKPSTIAARARRHSGGLASTKPLVDTGKMIQSVTYAVESK